MNAQNHNPELVVRLKEVGCGSHATFITIVRTDVVTAKCYAMPTIGKTENT